MDKKEHYNSLKRKIYVTRKSRINFSERLLKKGKYWDTITFFYTVYLIGLSMLGLKSSFNTENYSLVMIFLSVTVALVSLYSNSKNYKGRSESLRYNYISLEKFYQELLRLNPEENEEFKRIVEVENEYLEELKLTENHEEIDWYNAIKNDPKENSWLKEKCFIKIKIWFLNKVDISMMFILIIIFPYLWFIYFNKTLNI